MPNDEYTADFYKGPAYALVIGIRQYKYGKDGVEFLEDFEFPNLKVADKDAEDFANFLTHYGFIDYNVQLLVNEQAELSAIKDEFETLRKNCKQSGAKDPLVIVYFSGHGWADEDDRHYLIPYDAKRNKLYATALLNRDFSSSLDALDTNRLVVFLDACHAGALGMEGAKGALPQYDFHNDLGAGEGRYLIASCGPGQKSYEWKERENSIFTGHLLELLKGETADFDNSATPEIDIFDLYPALRDKVKLTALQEYGQDQVPISEMKGGRGIVLAINTRVRDRQQKESDQEEVSRFLELICSAIRAHAAGTSPKATVITRLRSYVIKKTTAKGFDDFYSVFDDQIRIWKASSTTYAFEDGCTLLIDAYEYAQAAAPASQQPVSQKAADNFVAKPEKTLAGMQERWPQANDLTQTPVAPPAETRAPADAPAPPVEKAGNIFNVRMQAVRGEPIKTPRSKVFISYSHKDKKWLNEFQIMLAPLIQKGAVDLWDDTKIEPGTLWKDEIEKALASTKVAVLLVTANFLASDFILKKELPPLLNDAHEKGVTIFWIPVSSCLVEETEIINYQAAHDPGKPLDQLSKADRLAVLSDVAGKIGNLIR